ncbi:hypothetical protein BDU57DRAFT_515247, partial [Ampelomyces quisqualis]
MNLPAARSPLRSLRKRTQYAFSPSSPHRQNHPAHKCCKAPKNTIHVASARPPWPLSVLPTVSRHSTPYPHDTTRHDTIRAVVVVCCLSVCLSRTGS